MQWALSRCDWIKEKLKNDLWTVVSKFETFRLKRRILIQRSVGGNIIPDSVTPTVKHSGFIMV